MRARSFDPVRVSRFIALVLRHDPGAAGLTLDGEGWTPVADLLQGLEAKGYDLTRAALGGRGEDFGGANPLNIGARGLNFVRPDA